MYETMLQEDLRFQNAAMWEPVKVDKYRQLGGVLFL